MSRNLRNAIIASMESDEVELMNPVTDQQETNIDEVLLEINEGADEVSEAEEVVEVLEEAEVALEMLATSLESCIEEGGMSPQAARIHNTAMSIALRGLPVDVDRVTVSSESFGGHGDKLSASQEALEGVKETLSKLWEGIKNAVKKAWEAVKSFIATFGKSGKAIKAAGADLIKRANATKGKAEGKIDATAMAKALHTDGEMSATASVALRVIVTGGQGVVASAKAAEVGLKDMAGAIASGSYKGVEELVDFSNKVCDPLPEKGLPGGRTIDISDAGVPSLNANVKLKLAEVEMAVPSIDEVKAIAQGIVKVGEFLETYSNSTFKSLEKSVNEFIASQDKLVKKVGMTKEETAKVRDALKGVNKSSSIARGCGPQYLTYAANSAKAAYSFGKKALGQYK